MANSLNVNPDPVPTLVEVLYPLLRTMEIVGLCPLRIISGKLSFQWKSFLIFRMFVNFLVLIIYIIYILQEAPNFFATADRNGLVLGLVELANELYGTIILLGIMSIVFFKKHQLLRFFVQMDEMKTHLDGYIDCAGAYRISRQLFVLYIVLGLTSAGMTALKIYKQPFNQISILRLFPGAGEFGIICGVGFHGYLEFLKSCACAYVEIISCVIAKSTVLMIQRIQISLFPNDAANSNLGIKSKVVQMGGKPNTEKFKALDWNVEGAIPMCTLTFTNNKIQHEEIPTDNHKPNTSSALTVLEGLQRFKHISSIQFLMNDIFGMILAQNVTLILVMTCVYSFRQIRLTIRFEVLDSSNVENVIVDQILAGITSFGPMLRLLILFLTLGNVQSCSLGFNSALSRGILDVKDASCVQMNTILAGLTTYSTNPMSFSAGGFFTFSRASLLKAISIVCTYIVILAQFNSNY